MIKDALQIGPVRDEATTASASQASSGVSSLQLLDGEGVFMLDTACAFHPSTTMLLELAVTHQTEWLAATSSVLDYGCGSGVLALAALRLSEAVNNPALKAFATDVNEAALVSAARNAAINGLGARLSLALPWELSRSVRAQLVFANMLAGPLISVAVEIAMRTPPGATLLLSGFQRSDLAAVARAYAPWFDVPPEPLLEQGGWLALKCVRTDAPLNSVDLAEQAVQ